MGDVLLGGNQARHRIRQSCDQIVKERKNAQSHSAPLAERWHAEITTPQPAHLALKHNPKIKAFYQRLLQNGRPKMVALIAAMRKLITILNVMIRNQQSWKNQPLTS